jgi:hypothetical protein
MLFSVRMIGVSEDQRVMPERSLPLFSLRMEQTKASSEIDQTLGKKLPPFRWMNLTRRLIWWFSIPRDSWWTIIKWRFPNIHIIFESFPSHSPFTASLWSWQIVHSELLIQYRSRCSSGPYRWFDAMDEISILTQWLANRAFLTLQSIYAHDRTEFDGKLILFFGNIGQLYPWLPISRYPPSIASLQASPIGFRFEKSQLK